MRSRVCFLQGPLLHDRDASRERVFHELTHSAGHARRLAREGFDTPQKFGSESYSREELIAEMGSAMLCGVASIEQSTLANSAAYLKAWIAGLKADSKLGISAASAAQTSGGSLRVPLRAWGSRADGALRGTP